MLLLDSFEQKFSTIRPKKSFNDKELSLVDGHENSNGAFQTSPSEKNVGSFCLKDVKPNISSSKMKEQVPFKVLR